MYKYIVCLFVVFCFSSSAYADMWIANNSMGGSIEKDKQYYVTVKCSPLMDLPTYMRRLNRKGEYKEKERRFGAATKISHYIVFSKSRGLSVKNGVIETAALTDIAGSLLSPVFSRDISTNKRSSLRLTSICNREFFLHGEKGQFALPIFSVSSSGKTASTVAATIVFAQTVLGAASEIIRNKPIHSDATKDLASTQDILAAYDAFQKALSGETLNSEPVELGVGSFEVRTHASKVKITISEHDSYLESWVPFLANRDSFLENKAKPNLSLSSSSLEKENVVKFQAACRETVEALSQSGLKSKADQAFLLGIALSRHSPDKLNSIRCFVETELAQAHLRDKVQKWSKRKAGRTTVFSELELKEYLARYGEEIPEDTLPPEVKQKVDPLPKQAKQIRNFLSYYSHFVGQQDDQQDKSFPRSKLLNAMEEKLFFYDTANLIGGFRIRDEPDKILQELSKKGFNRYNCYFQKTADHERKLGDLAFNDAQFALLMHKVDPLSLSNKDSKILTPKTAVVLRGYFDESSNKISAFETAAVSALPFFTHHKTCNSLLKTG